MSSDYNHERLETLQKHYRCAWSLYAAEVENLQTAQENGDSEHLVAGARERVEKAAVGYRVARDAMALFLLEHTAESVREPEYAVARTA